MRSGYVDNFVEGPAEPVAALAERWRKRNEANASRGGPTCGPTCVANMRANMRAGGLLSGACYCFDLCTARSASAFWGSTRGVEIK